MSFTYQYPHPAVCVDIIVICKQGNKILLIERKHPPFENMWAFPGGFVEMQETLEQSALRELYEETGVKLNSLNQFAAYGNPGRDPRERTVSIVFYEVIPNEIETHAGDDAAKSKWHSINNLPPLAFDHDQILNDFIQNKLSSFS